MARLTRVRALLAACVLSCGLAGCVSEGPAEPTALTDPCLLISDDMLGRLAPGSARVPQANLGNDSGTKECAVDLTAGTASMRGDLLVTVGVDGTDAYDDAFRSDRCDQIGAKPATSGPGDASCLVVSAWDGSETRIDGWAWVDDDYEVQVAYQVVDPQELPPGAEQDLRDLLAAAVDSLPAP